MTRQQFRDAVHLARLGEIAGDIDRFRGFGLKDYPETVCDLNDMAALIRWQALQFDGRFDRDSLQEIWSRRRKFVVVGA